MTFNVIAICGRYIIIIFLTNIIIIIILLLLLLLLLLLFHRVFCVGLIGEKQISAFSICFQVEGFAWMVILSYFVFYVILFLITFSFFTVFVSCWNQASGSDPENSNDPHRRYNQLILVSYDSSECLVSENGWCRRVGGVHHVECLRMREVVAVRRLFLSTF